MRTLLQALFQCCCSTQNEDSKASTYITEFSTTVLIQPGVSTVILRSASTGILETLYRRNNTDETSELEDKKPTIPIQVAVWSFPKVPKKISHSSSEPIFHR